MQARSVLTALGLVGLILTSGDVVSAATTGHPLLLGHDNHAAGTTTLRTSAAGAPLRLASRPGQAPLAVGSATKVRLLNADLLDGLSSSSFARSATTLDLRYSVKNYTKVVFDQKIPRLPRGQYLITYSVSMYGNAGTPDDPLRGEAYIVQGPGGAVEKQTLYTADESSLSSAIDQFMSFSGSGVVDTRQYPDVMLEIELNNADPRPVKWSTIPTEPIQITVTPLGGYRRTTTAR